MEDVKTFFQSRTVIVALVMFAVSAFNFFAGTNAEPEQVAGEVAAIDWGNLFAAIGSLAVIIFRVFATKRITTVFSLVLLVLFFVGSAVVADAAVPGVSSSTFAIESKQAVAPTHRKTSLSFLSPSFSLSRAESVGQPTRFRPPRN